MVKKTNKNRKKRRETRKNTPGLKNMSNSNNSNSNSNNNINYIRKRKVVIPKHLRRPNHEEIPTFNPPPPPPSMNPNTFTSSLGNYQPTPEPRQRGRYRRNVLTRNTNGRVKASHTINRRFDPVNAHELYRNNIYATHVPNKHVRVVNMKQFKEEQKKLRNNWRKYRKNEKNRQKRKTKNLRFKSVKGKTKKKQNIPSAKEVILPQTAIRSTRYAPQASVTYANLITKPYNSNNSSNNESVTYPTANIVNRNNRAAENYNAYHIREPINENNQIEDMINFNEYNGNYNGRNNGEYYYNGEYNNY